MSVEENWTKPPIPQVVPWAKASATHIPFHMGLGHMETIGEMVSNQEANIFKTRWESLDSFLLEELGSRILNQMRLSERRHA